MHLSNIIFKDKEIKIYEIDNKVAVNDEFVNEKFFYPRSATIYNDEIFISDSYNNVIKVFDKNLKKKFEIGRNILSEPIGLEVIDNMLYICDSGNSKIQIFDLTGNYVGLFKENLKRPTHIMEFNDKIYINDTNEHCIYILNKKGEIIYKITKNLKYPSGIAFSNKYLYVASQFSKSILRYSFDGLYIDKICEGEYYCNIAIKGNELFYIDEEKFKLSSIILNENEIEEIKEIDSSERAYYFYIKDKNKWVHLFNNINFLDKKYEKENIEIADKLKNKNVYEYMAKYAKNKKYYSEILNEPIYFLELEKEISNIENEKLDKPKGIAVDDEYIWMSLFNKKIILKMDLSYNVKMYFTSEIQTEKIVAKNEKVWLIDYFYKRIFKLIQETGEMVEFTDKIQSPVDLKIINNSIVILDSVLKKIKFFSLEGSYFDSFKIDNIYEPVSFDYFDGNYYILDKKTGKIYIYNNRDKVNIIENKNNFLYPEGIAIDEDGYIYITDEGNNRLVKINQNGNFIYELLDFNMPKDIIYKNNKIYISDFGNNIVKIYKVR